MANEDNTAKIDELCKQQGALFEKLSVIVDQQDSLWKKLTEGGEDKDGYGFIDVDKDSADYKEFQKLEEDASKIWDEVEAIDLQIGELGGLSLSIFQANTIEGTDGNDKLVGSDKTDDIFGGKGDDILSGKGEYDFLNGGEGNDTISGDGGDDSAFGGEGNDVLNGGDGSDYLDGGTGDDTMTGGKGEDHFTLSGLSGHDVITDFNPAEDNIDLWSEGMEFKDLKSEHTSAGLKVSWGENSVLLKGVSADLSEDWFYVSGDIGWCFPIEPFAEINVVRGTDGADTLNGTDGMDDLYGGDGNDVLSGGDGFDFLMGDAGDDVLNGGGHSDFLDGGTGNDTMTGGAGNDHYTLGGNSGHDVITDFNTKEDTIDLWGEGTEFKDLKSEKTAEGLKVSWGENSVLLKGVTEDLSADWFWTFDSTVIGIPVEPDGGIGGPIGGVNVVFGTDGADTLEGTEEDDDLLAAGGDDVLDGKGGFDYLYGGEGNDTMTGGADSDVFFFGEKSGHDTITDFSIYQDQIDLGAAGIEYADISSKQENGGTTLSWGDNSIFLNGVTEAVDEGWFSFGRMEDIFSSSLA